MTYEARWEVLDKLGSGGGGKVWLARDKKKFDPKSLAAEFHDGMLNLANTRFPDKQAEAFPRIAKVIQSLQHADNPLNLGALKELHSPEEARDAERAEERIRLEILAMQEMDHSNLLRILDSDPDERWYVSEFHPYGTLAKNLIRYQGNVAAAIRALRPVIDAVRMVHEKRMVHRDIKPLNIFLSKNADLVLGDFGLVYFVDAQHTRLSATMDNVGTRDWMPPWAMGVRIENVRPTFDVFALGKVLWAMISGQQFLNLWYFRRPAFDLEARFPGDSHARIVNGLLDKCVVEEESHCLPDAGALLEEIDGVLRIIDSGATVYTGASSRPCSVCGVGHYEQLAGSELENSGIGQPSGTKDRLKAFICPECGHIQTFLKRKPDSPSLWNWVV